MKVVVKILIILFFVEIGMSTECIFLNELKVDMASSACNGPLAFGIKEYEIVVSDNLSGRAAFFSLEGIFRSSAKNRYACYAERILLGKDGEFHMYYNGKTFAVDDKDGNKKLFVYFEKSSYVLKDNRSIFYDGERVIAVLKSGELISIPSPGNDNAENLRNVEDQEATVDYIFNSSTGIAIEFSEDDEIYITLDGRLQTFNYQQFVRFYGITAESTDTEKSGALTFDFVTTNKWYFTLLGHDQAGNWYWQHEKGDILKFSDEGILKDVISTVGISSKVTPAVHPDGTIYFLDYDEAGVRMHTINNN